MVTRLISLALVLVIGGSVFAGIPLHSNEQECSMPGMATSDPNVFAMRPLRVGSEANGYYPVLELQFKAPV
jgi:hypothetical protein